MTAQTKSPAGFERYLLDLRKNLARGDATEHTHRPALKALLEGLGADVVATNEPKRIACGAPDFSVSKRAIPIGYAETKDVETDLDEMSRGKGPDGEQFKRYVDGLPNWILTDYLEFRWFVNGKERFVSGKGRPRARLGHHLGKGKIEVSEGGQEGVRLLLDAFFKQEAFMVGTARDLAERLSRLTRILRTLIADAFESEEEDEWLHGWLSAFRDVLIPDLDQAKFADMFAQTLSYGLFAAWVHTPNARDFSREKAAFSLPRTNPFLRKLFAEFAGVSMPEQFAWVVDDIVELLKRTDPGAVMKDFASQKGRQDPVVHFYETFLAAYDPKIRELRGVYYTPEAVVQYIVRSIDDLLRSRFNKSKGLGDEKTLILDPAVGTATFPYFVIKQIRSGFKGQKGAWNSYVSHHLLNRLFGFELLMAPYSIAHLKLGTELQATGYEFASDQRLGIYLTNTLEESLKRGEKWFQWISEEANSAAEIKRDRPILVVLGNPPYSGHSANRSWLKRTVQPGETYTVVRGGPLKTQRALIKVTAKKKREIKEKTFIGRLLDDYYFVDDLPLGEKNPKWLQDDYVKFIRFAQWRIDRTGHGILGFITNHAYLENPTFRGMRRSLMREFSELYILDLHGNQKRKEKAPDGSKDENVFDIQQGVAILLAVKQAPRSGEAAVYHSELWGSREAKYTALLQSDVTRTKWTAVQPVAPYFLFVPRDRSLFSEYELGWKITDVMRTSSLGIVTARDSLAIRFTADEMKKTIKRFAGLKPEQARVEFKLGGDRQDWGVERAQQDLLSGGLSDSNIKPILYRPFDTRFTYYTGNSGGFHCRPRAKVMRHLLAGDNIALCLSRSVEIDRFEHVFCSGSIAGHHSSCLKEVNYVFPLYLYPNNDGAQGILLPDHQRRANLSKEFLEALAAALDLPLEAGGLPQGVSPRDVFNYIYAILHAGSFRTRYADFLQQDFCRIPLARNRDRFRRLASIGNELTGTHLMTHTALDSLITEFPETGTNRVEAANCDVQGRAWINRQQYFAGVPKRVWEFKIGGYQVCRQWLKDRKGRELTWSDIQHFQRLVVAVNQTTRLMAEVESCIPGWPVD